MSAEPKKHHSVPQSLLRNFSIRGERRSVFVFDKTSLRSFPSPIVDAGAERDFYRVDLGSQELNFEQFFQRLDDRLAALLVKVVESTSLGELSEGERYDLAVVTACQLLRTKLRRTSPVEIARELSQRLRDQGFESPEDLTDNDSRFISLKGLLQLEPLAELLARKDLLLLVSREAALWVSDNPVVLHNTFPYGRAALAAPGVEIYYPLSARVCLGFLCPSIREMLAESFDPRHPRPTSTDPLLPRVSKSIREGTPLEVDSNYPLFLNSLQIGQSSRFLYSSEDNFDLAREAVSSHPKLRRIRSLVSVGRMGSAPPPDPRMPLGHWLVVEKEHRHHMLPVEPVDEGSWTIDFTTTDLVKLALVEQETPFDCVTLYDNGQMMRMIREVEFLHVEQSGRHFVRVQHSDASMNALMQQINTDRP